MRQRKVWVSRPVKRKDSIKITRRPGCALKVCASYFSFFFFVIMWLSAFACTRAKSVFKCSWWIRQKAGEGASVNSAPRAKKAELSSCSHALPHPLTPPVPLVKDSAADAAWGDKHTQVTNRRCCITSSLICRVHSLGNVHVYKVCFLLSVKTKSSANESATVIKKYVFFIHHQSNIRKTSEQKALIR